MVTVRRYPFGQEALELDPTYECLRDTEPLSRVELPYGGPAWLVTRYEDAKAVLVDQRFSRAAAVGRDMARVRPEVVTNTANILNMDGPEHSRQRRLVAKAFTVARIEALRPRAEKIAEELLDAMVANGPPADVVGRLGVPLAATVVCELLGVRAADHLLFVEWTDVLMSNGADPVDQKVAFTGLTEYIAEMVAERRRHPSDDLLGSLVAARDAENRLSEHEVMTLGTGILMAGQSSIPYQLGSFLYLLLARPALAGRLRAEPENVPRAVEEFVRFVPLVSAAEVSRVATADVQLGDVTVRAGDTVLIALHAANRDPRMFPDPDELSLDRKPGHHLGFGHGPHYCLGVHLARMELQVAIGALLRRFDELALAVPAGTIEWRTDTQVRGPDTLPVTWTGDTREKETQAGGRPA